MRPVLFSLAVLLAAAALGCKKSPQQDQALLKANFQKAQREKAIKVYEEIATKYPDSPNAAKAKERARILRAQAGPAAPKKK